LRIRHTAPLGDFRYPVNHRGDAALAATPDAQAGQKLFESVGCNTCHVESITTAPAARLSTGARS
jgi:cytochrome c5